jgi:stearoyl-CoA desaturase (delta-9 desaturase)
MEAVRSGWRTYFNATSIPFWGSHILATISLISVGWEPRWLIGTAVVYAVGMFFTTAAYHRYFSHRSFKTSRPFQFLLAIGATITCQKGPLWWAACHRHHHKHSDTPEDAHSAQLRGFLWSHMGWFLGDEFRRPDYRAVGDLAKYPELRLMDRLSVCFIPALIYAVLMYTLAGPTAFAYLTFFPLVLIWHGTFTINSLAHIFGRRRYATTDHSKNNALLALITLGEGWHNNHHHYQRSCRQGFRWYEIDITYMILRVLSWFGLVWDLGEPPRHIVDDVPKAEIAAAKS